MKRFIGNVNIQIVERYLLADLDTQTFTPLIVNEMAEEDVASIAAEPEETTRERSSLEARKAMLEEGQKTFKSALGLFKGAASKK